MSTTQAKTPYEISKAASAIVMDLRNLEQGSQFWDEAYRVILRHLKQSATPNRLGGK